MIHLGDELYYSCLPYRDQRAKINEKIYYEPCHVRVISLSWGEPTELWDIKNKKQITPHPDGVLHDTLKESKQWFRLNAFKTLKELQQRSETNRKYLRKLLIQ